MIKVKDLSFSYPESKRSVLRNVSFAIERGEIFGFLGPSGAGKSTTQKILYKVLTDYSGEIAMHAKPLSEWGNEYFEKIGVGFELPNHYLKLTARENLKLFASFYPSDRILDLDLLLETFGLIESASMRVETFSKGMKMRLNFIRAIMHDPDILFLDEPTAGLDPRNAKSIKNYIKKLQGDGKTIFVTTHDMTTADELCDRVSFIADGEIRITEKPSVLKKAHGRDMVRVVREDDEEREFPLTELGRNAEFLDFIARGRIERIDTQEASLEDVFIKITGSTLNE